VTNGPSPRRHRRPRLLAHAAAAAFHQARRAADHAYGPGRGTATVNIADVQLIAAARHGLPVSRAQAAAALRAYLEARRPLDVRTDAYLPSPTPPGHLPPRHQTRTAGS
jgi:hypothetical protein